MTDDNNVRLAVCGLHMRDFPLNKQLTELGAEYVETVETAPLYKMYALPTFPQKPGMVKTESGGTAIEVEVWKLSYDALGRFLSRIPSPLGLGQIVLSDNSVVTGFICEPYIIEHSEEISAYGGWRYYLSARR